MEDSFSFIRGVGIEMEGLYKRDENDEEEIVVRGDFTMDRENYFLMDEIKGDSSIRWQEGYRAREITSRVLKKRSEVERFINYFTPALTNESCGMHIHISLDNLNINVLVNEKSFRREFYSFLREFASERDWRRLKERVEGRNHYCLRGSNFGDVESRYSSRSRYRILNIHSYLEHKTMECRVFPCYSVVKKNMEMAFAYLDFVEGYFSRLYASKRSRNRLLKLYLLPIETKVEEDEEEMPKHLREIIHQEAPPLVLTV